MADKKPPRHSEAEEASLITNEDEKAAAEARNALKQYDLVLALIDEWLQPDRKFKLRPSIILQLHRAALEGLSSHAGNWRPAGVTIGDSKHQPPAAHLVAELIEQLCDYINENWETKSAIHLASYAMWRLNWIHPFSDGNGRTSRALSYLVLCLKLEARLPGKTTIPEQIAEDKSPYYEALESADQNSKDGHIDLSAMEALLDAFLAKQLLDAYKLAKGETPQTTNTKRLH